MVRLHAGYHRRLHIVTTSFFQYTLTTGDNLATFFLGLSDKIQVAL